MCIFLEHLVVWIGGYSVIKKWSEEMLLNEHPWKLGLIRNFIFILEFSKYSNN